MSSTVPPCRQIGQDMLHGDSHVADDRLAAEDVRANGDAIEQVGLLRHGVLLRFCFWSFGDLRA